MPDPHFDGVPAELDPPDNPRPPRSADGWRLDKTVPVAVLVTMVVLVIGGVFAWARLSDRVDSDSGRIGSLEATRDVRTREMATIGAEIASMQATIADIKADMDTLVRIELQRNPPSGARP